MCHAEMTELCHQLLPYLTSYIFELLGFYGSAVSVWGQRGRHDSHTVILSSLRSSPRISGTLSPVELGFVAFDTKEFQD